jgi:hypothetical protein
MIVTTFPQNGNSSKFHVVTKRGEFDIALSYTLRSKVWELSDADAELEAAKQLSEAIVSRHDPKFPFKTIYIFAEHNCDPSLTAMVNKIRKNGYLD